MFDQAGNPRERQTKALTRRFESVKHPEGSIEKMRVWLDSLDPFSFGHMFEQLNFELDNADEFGGNPILCAGKHMVVYSDSCGACKNEQCRRMPVSNKEHL